MILPEFFDIINYAICQAVNHDLPDEAKAFFQKVGDYHLDEALTRGFITLHPEDAPLEVLIKIAKYLESTGYMQKITIQKLSEHEAIVEMQQVSVTRSSAQLLQADKQPSHFMTNIMFAALRRRGVQADLRHMDYDVENATFKEYWKIL
jgi:hypothetical protein